MPAPAAALAEGSPAAMCEEAARLAAEQTGVPLSVLRAITLTETGRSLPGAKGQLSPWPWATNEGGSGNWFDSREEAFAHIDARLAEGVTNIDIGCFQLNHRWHAPAFASAEDMIDPLANALYAASLLKRHYARLGDWSLAAGAYHSGTKEYAERYRTRFDAIHAALAEAPPPALQLAAAEPRENNFPLLRPGSRVSGPSLFPATAAGRPLIGD